MSFASWIPEIWSGTVLTAVERNLVFANLCNRDYEGDLAQAGDTVRINSVSDPSIGSYTKNSTTLAPENLDTTDQTLVVDQAPYFNFEVDDIDKRQGKGDLLTKQIKRAGYLIAKTIDAYVIGLYTGVAAANQVNSGSAVTTNTGDLAYTGLRKLALELDEADVPDGERWAVVPAWYHSLLLENSKFVANPANTEESKRALQQGLIGHALGMDIYKSNACPLVTGDDYVTIAGTKAAISLVIQINSIEPFRPENAFSDAVKGLTLYGAKMIRPDHVSYMLASQT